VCKASHERVGFCICRARQSAQTKNSQQAFHEPPFMVNMIITLIELFILVQVPLPDRLSIR
jgi:hypothetical protein